VLFLARFILKGQSQAALVAATTAILGMLIPPAAWLSAAAIALVTLVNGAQRGLVALVLSLLAAAVFAYLIFSVPQVVIDYVLLIWLPVWALAVVLRHTVSLALSLQLLTVVCLVIVAVLYQWYPDFGEHWRQPLDMLMTQLAEQSTELSIKELKQTEEWIIQFLPGLFVSSIMFGTILSLFLARWWQAVLYNPGGFGKEFQGLNLGKISALIGIAVFAAAMIDKSVFVFALATVIFVLYSMQALSLLHAAIRIRKLNVTWLIVIYVLMIFMPQLLMVLMLLGFADPWLDIRQRLARTA
jgi:hypothetical protein